MIGMQQMFVRGPKIPEAETGYIIPYSNHGDIHYATQQSFQIFEWSKIVGPMAAIAAILVGLVGKRRRESG